MVTLSAALERMAAHQIHVHRLSRFYLTPAWPDAGAPPFVNAVVHIQTPLRPAALLETLHRIEAHFDRVRSFPNAPRTLDIDLLDYDGLIEIGPPILPHPRLAERAFVLIPLADVAPEWRHPVSKLSIGECIAGLSDADRAAVQPVMPNSHG